MGSWSNWWPGKIHVSNWWMKFWMASRYNVCMHVTLCHWVFHLYMQVIKPYAWERPFKRLYILEKIRNSELDVLLKAAFLNAATSFTWTCAPFLVSNCIGQNLLWFLYMEINWKFMWLNLVYNEVWIKWVHWLVQCHRSLTIILGVLLMTCVVFAQTWSMHILNTLTLLGISGHFCNICNCAYKDSTNPADRLTADKMFVTFSLFNILWYPLIVLPMLVNFLIQVSVCILQLLLTVSYNTCNHVLHIIIIFVSTQFT